MSGVIPGLSAAGRRIDVGWSARGDIPTVIGAILLGLGAMVMCGWVFQVPQLVRVMPHLTSMVFNTALGLALMGAALLRSARPGKSALVQAQLLAGIVLALAVLNLVQILSSRTLGINLPGLHDWMLDGHALPGQMSTPTTVELMLGSLSFLLLHSRLGRTRIGRVLTRAGMALMFSIASLALVGYALDLDGLYTWYVFGFMAVHTATGMLLLSIALWFRQNRLDMSFGARLEERIVAIGSWTLVLVALVAGLSGVLILRDEAEQEIARSLDITHEARVDSIVQAIRMRSIRAELVATRPDIRALLPHSAVGRAGGSAALEAMARFGFSAIELRDASGHPVAGTGALAVPATLSVPLAGDFAGEARLAWRDGYRLQNHFELRDGERLLGTLHTEQVLEFFGHLLAGRQASDREGTQTQLCAHLPHGLSCFPRQTQAPAAIETPVRSEHSPTLLALQGRSGHLSFLDAAGERHSAAYSPVGATGLIAMTTLDNGELFESLRQRLLLGVLVLAAFTLAGALALRRSIRPLAEALVRSERRSRAIVDTLAEGVVLQDRQHRVVISNPAAARILGVSEAELQGVASGDPRWSLMDAAGRPCALADYPAPRTLRTGVAERDVTMGLIDPAGRVRWLEVSTAPIVEATGPAVVVSFSDITDKRLAQRRLAESESRYQLMVNQVVDYAILMLDAEGRVASWNRGAERLKGYAADEIIGRHFSCFFTQEDRAAGKPAQELQAATQNGRCEMEGWRVRKDGSRFWGQMALTAVRNGDGELMGFAKVTHDLSERRRAEQAVAEAGRRMQAMIESSPFGIVAVDLEGVIQNMNLAGLRMVGYTRDELVGHQTPAIYHDPEEIRVRARELSQETGQDIEPGLEVFVHKARLGLCEEREWTCVRKDGRRFPIQSSITPLRDPEGQLVGFMGVAIDISERKKREDYTLHVATHDFLTGLPTRRLLGDRLEMAMQRARRNGTRVGVLLIDLDHFKRINDSLGHHVGDELLTAVAERLSACVRGSDTVARMGGDEFVILLPDIAGAADAERVAQLVVQRVSAPVSAGVHELHVSPSVGMALYPEDGADASELLRNADAAMYAAKAAGRGCYRAFSRQMQRDADQRLLLENDLRAALQAGQLQVHYQPQVCLHSGRVLGMEALVRWTHPQRGAVSPQRFIPIAEESDLILTLGEWVLCRACEGARRLQERTGEPLTVSVNLSPRQFRAPELTTLIAAALRDSGLAPQHLEVEITEGMLMADADGAIERLRSIRALGVRIAVDDFGTGYSSLAYITRFSIDTLKIDRSFIQRMQGQGSDAAVVLTIVALSRNLGLRVVAEGVETPEQLGFLRAQAPAATGTSAAAQDFGVQGFHFSPAQSEEDFLRSFEALQTKSQRTARLAEIEP